MILDKSVIWKIDLPMVFYLLLTSIPFMYQPMYIPKLVQKCWNIKGENRTWCMVYTMFRLAMTCLLHSSKSELMFHMTTNWIRIHKHVWLTAQYKSLPFKRTYISCCVMIQLTAAPNTSGHQLWYQFRIIISITQLNTKRTKHHVKLVSGYKVNNTTTV